ncbi:hypothetical protein OG799_12960 [Micromonospora sp. NBC_00898]|nr:hypothetical protein OG799_12960 [Micromonospora sp. NBC_00898]
MSSNIEHFIGGRWTCADATVRTEDPNPADQRDVNGTRAGS